MNGDVISMKEISLEEKKEIMLEVLSDIDVFCRDNNIQYCLIGGSLLGAIRHEGYIPWDDDIDIGMMRDDYEYFMSHYRSASGKTQALDFRNCKHYIWPAAKVIHTDTVLYENNYKKVDIGVHVDLFSFDDVPGSIEDVKKYCRRIYRYRNILTIKHLLLSSERSVLKNALIICGKVFYIVPDKWLLGRIHKLSCKYKGIQSDYVCNFAGAWKEKEIHRRSILVGKTMHKFENGEFPIPIGYDEYLKSLYGDYMKLPPKDKQKAHHGAVSYWKYPQ